MKRYIRSTTMEDLAYYKDEVKEHLPTWYLTKSKEEIVKAKRTVADYYPESWQDTEYPVSLSEDEERKLRRDLRQEGFDPDEIDEIIARVENGSTVDSAIQRQYDRRDYM